MYNVDLMYIQGTIGYGFVFPRNVQPAAFVLTHVCNDTAVTHDKTAQEVWRLFDARGRERAEETGLLGGLLSGRGDFSTLWSLFSTDLPSEDPADKIGIVLLSRADGIGRPSINVFRSICAFAQIQSRVYKKLYSVKASKKSQQKLIATIDKLVNE
jgi:hypothetical protein